MKRFYFLFMPALCILFLSTQAFGQDPCITWDAPSSTSGWIDFNNTFGGAPCDDGQGCAFNEITTFEVWASEAYSVDNFVASGTYSFSMCNGPGAGSWIPEFTIIAPSGAVDAFGPGDGDSCTITWTASESGTYLIVINEDGECDTGAGEIGNGFPALTCTTSNEVVCIMAPVDSTCFAGTLVTTEMRTVCDLDSFALVVIEDSIPTGGGYGYLFNPALGGTGALEGEFLLSGVSQMTSYDNDLNGVLSNNNFPLMAGTWIIKGAVYSDADNTFSSICSITADSLIVTFGQTPTIDDITDNSDGTATVTVSGGATPYTYLWSNGQTTETATNLPPGSISVLVTEANGCSAMAEVDIMVNVSEIEQLETLSVFPNPTNNRLFVEIGLNTQETVSLQLFDITGKRVQSRIQEQILANTFELDMTSYPAGVYTLRIQVGNNSVSRRIIVE